MFSGSYNSVRETALAFGLATALCNAAPGVLAGDSIQHGSRATVETVTAFLDDASKGSMGGDPEIRWQMEPDSSSILMLRSSPSERWRPVDPATGQQIDRPTANIGPDLEPLPVARPMFPMWGWNRRPERSPDARHIATLEGDNIAVIADGDTLFHVTTDGSPDFQYFLADDIWEYAGPVWSPNSNRFAFRSHDMRAVEGPTWASMGKERPVSRKFRLWGYTGQPLPITRFFIYDVDGKNVQPLDIESGPDHYLFFLEWRPDNKAVALARVSRDLSRYELLEADVETGRIATLLKSERPGSFVKWPGNPRGFRYLPGGGFMWRSDETGYQNWREFSATGAFLRHVTRAPFSIGEIAHIDTDGSVFALGAPDPDRPYDQQLLHFTAADAFTVLTPEPGMHKVSFSADGQHFVTSHNYLDRAPSVDLRRRDGTFIATLASAQVTPERAERPAPLPVTALGADNKTIIHGLMILPRDFDPSRRYPVIERIYGGMQAVVQKRQWPEGPSGTKADPYRLMPHILADHGFIVVMFDSPGTPGRGRAYLEKAFGTWPDGIIADHAAALRDVARTRPWMDLSRVGIDGNSWGGTLALRALMEAPELYAAASVSAPQTDQIDSASWSEFQLGSFQDNRAAFERAGLVARAAEIKGKVLLIAGDADVNVPFSNASTMLNAMQKARVEHRFLFLPFTNHTLSTASESSYPLAIAEVVNFFLENLGEETKEQD